jgi:hypothetical protein
MIIFPYPGLYETKSIKYIVCLMHTNICPHAFMITGIHPLLNHVEFHKSCGNTNCEIPHDYSHKCICVYYVYMIAGIHPLLNHAITHCEINMIHSCIHGIHFTQIDSRETLLSICDCRHSSITQPCGNTNCEIQHD